MQLEIEKMIFGGDGLARYAKPGEPRGKAVFVPFTLPGEQVEAEPVEERPGFIRAHVYALDRARGEGVNVIGYMHWSLIDNFEWSHGYEGRFGLFTIDFAGDSALERRPTPAVATFQDLARDLGLLPPAPLPPSRH